LNGSKQPQVFANMLLAHGTGAQLAEFMTTV
jgi:hypothetical protein